MDGISDDVLLEELNRRFLDNKKALHDMKVMNEKIEKLNTKLTESERLKTNFLSNIRNEMNNPITSILGMARELAGPIKDDAMRQTMAQMIYKEAFDLDFQLRNIFIAAELEAGEAKLSRARTDVASLVRGLVSSFAHKVREKNLTVDFDCCGEQQEPALWFNTDPEKLHWVLANLIANAIEFNQPGKALHITARKGDDTLQISVADEGAGIPEAQRAHLFERFRQLDYGTAKKHKGHGLGLSITKALVEILRGKISLRKADGGGTMFEVSIPDLGSSTEDVFSADGNDFLFENGRTF